MKLLLFVSHSGLCSRRDAMDLIQGGHIKVNGVVIREPSSTVEPQKDRVYFRERQLSVKENIYIVINKPKGVTTTKEDRFAKVTIMDLLPTEYRHLNPVGRLDQDTTGLLILTNDGDLTHKLTHPSFHIDKIYIADLDRSLTNKDRVRLENGVELEDGKTLPCKIFNLEAGRVKINIHEGRKRQIKLMFKIVGYKVRTLRRVSIGNLQLGDLKEGSWRKLSNIEVGKLKDADKKYGK